MVGIRNIEIFHSILKSILKSIMMEHRSSSIFSSKSEINLGLIKL